MLMVCAFAYLLPNHDWFLQTQKEKLVNISKIPDHIGNAISLVIPSLFVLIGCDTVSFFFRKSKKAIFDRVLKRTELAVKLLNDLGVNTRLSESAENKLKKFVQIFIYG